MTYGPINIDPEIMSGTPVFTGTKVPVQTLFDYIEGGDNLNEFLDDFPDVSKDAAIQVLEMAKKTLNTEKMLYDITGSGIDAKSNSANDDQLSGFQKFLLSGPEMTDEQFNSLQEKRNHFNEWK